jgi:hypothetical protein
MTATGKIRKLNLRFWCTDVCAILEPAPKGPGESPSVQAVCLQIRHEIG